MKVIFGMMLLLVASMSTASATGVNVETVKFIQYLDENTALEQVRNGNLDMYYSRIPSDRIEDAQSKQGLKIYESTGGSYSILVNPAESKEFNPFFYKEVRFALNYLVDRDLIVNELMGGYGVPMVSNYGLFDPEYLAILNELEEFQFRYNPELADQMITQTLEEQGAKKIDNVWTFEQKPIKITIFIRSDDPVRKSIGEILASELENMGFAVVKDFGDLNKAFVVVYGTDPAQTRWNLYTEGWGGRSAFVGYDSVGLAQMYAPWFSNMPGFNDSSYWNYQNEYLDDITQKIYTGDFESAIQRNELIQKATVEAINESVRVFLASKIDQYVVNENISGVVNDFGAGVPTRFTPINAKGATELNIGVKQIYQGAWNPVRGLTDSYSTHIWNPINDPGVFKHPFTGKSIPIRTPWSVQTGQSISVPNDAILWNPQLQKWDAIQDATATSKVTFDLEFSNWHNGAQMDIYDVLYSIYFALEWGTNTGDDDKTFDAEYTPQAEQLVSTLVGVKIVDDDTIEVYVNYTHFDEAEIASWASVWSVMPWEIYQSMEQSVLDGKVAFSRSAAGSKNVNWLSLIVPNDAQIIKSNIQQSLEQGVVPVPLQKFELDQSYYDNRYNRTIDWIEQKNHAIISNGPFYLESYSPESRTITLIAFDDETYPFKAGHWSDFENVKFPKVVNVDIPRAVSGSVNIDVQTKDASNIIYFLSNKNKITHSDSINLESNSSTIHIPNNVLKQGTNNIKIFAISNDVSRPDMYATSFLFTDQDIQLEQQNIQPVNTDTQWTYIIPIIGIALAVFILIRLGYIQRLFS